MSGMNAIRHIRKSVLGLTQSDMALIAEVSQGTISKWENSDGPDQIGPSRVEMARIRAEAIKRGLSWDDSWFFESPAEVAQ